MAASQLAVRAIHLHDGHALGVQEASESGSVATGPFDADTLDRNVAAAPSPIGLVRASIEMTGGGPDGIAIGDALQGAGEDVDISDQIAAVYQWDEGAQT